MRAHSVLTDRKTQPADYLEIQGARVHNLKGIDLRLPHNQLVVVTGVSGSGKSSLVFDLIYAEGRRRYVESLSSYARQFLERIEKPDADQVLGIAPTVAIRQKNTTRNPRSTVATATEIHDYLRVLFARAGRMHCIRCDRRVESDSVDRVTDIVLSQNPGSRWHVLLPVRASDIDSQVLREERYAQFGTPLRARLAQLRERGFDRLFQKGRVFRFSKPEDLLELDLKKQIFALADRIAIGPGIEERVADAVEIAYSECGEVIFAPADAHGQRLRFSNKFECSRCKIPYPRPEPNLFNANGHYSACGRCDGVGYMPKFSLDRFVDRPELSLERGAITHWEGASKRTDRQLMLLAAQRRGVPTHVPFSALGPADRKFLEHGDKQWPGIRGYVKTVEAAGWKGSNAALLVSWQEQVECTDCLGSKLSQQAMSVRLGGESIAKILRFSLGQALEFFRNLQLERSEAVIADSPLTEIRNRLRFLNDVGLQYLSLNRPAPTLSGGEAQRIQLASSLGSRLVGVCYVLDEPSIGLHSRDTDRLIGTLKELRDLGNTVFVVEHDRAMMHASDHLVDLGPAAGERGGEVVYSGPWNRVPESNGSLTGRYLAGRSRIEPPAQRRPRKRAKNLKFHRAKANNLKGIDVEIPVGLLNVITGVSGSGKSTLMHEIILRGVDQELRRGPYLRPHADQQVQCAKITGHTRFRAVVLVDQDATDRTSRSVPATYIRVFDEVRHLFSRTKQALDRSLTAADFSFNTGYGRCLVCAGSGRQTVDMQFLADVDLPCEECEGRRFRAAVLDVKYKGKSIWDVLQMTATEALAFFADRPAVVTRLEVLNEVGLGYLRLGQPATQLSGGEAQRLKLALHIADNTMRNTLFLFDEPTTGLHFEDIRKLLAVFDKLIENGATLVVVEHNLDVIKCADWIVDLGPEGGEDGGRIVTEGPPEKVAAHAESHTARYLREALA